MTFEPVIQNIPRTNTGIAEWCAAMLFVLLLGKRYSKVKTAAILAAGFIVQMGLQQLDGTLPKILWVPGMLLAVVLMITLILICCKIPIETAVYHGVRAFILAELAASLEWQLYDFIISDGIYDILVVRIAYIIMVYGAIFMLAFVLERKNFGSEMVLRVSKKEMWTAVIIGAFIFAFSNLSFVIGATPFTSSRDVDIFNIRTLADICGYLLLFLHYVQIKESFLRYEKDTMETMLHSQLMQYKLSRESIDLVNRKYHDLKHQIGVLRAETNDEVRNAYLDQMADEIRVYEAQYQTGNKILDTILTSQNLYCQKHGIEMTCVADGQLLEFMDVMDICTIFGNALDNAIECELKIADKSRRMIRLKVFRQKQFVLISVMNYCEEVPVMESGLPLTSKKDHAYHGFGVKSIQVSAEKYGGTISVSMEDYWFKLMVMIPLKESDSSCAKRYN